MSQWIDRGDGNWNKDHHTEAKNDARITSAEFKTLSLPICGFFQFSEDYPTPITQAVATTFRRPQENMFTSIGSIDSL
jgi:hypothetical protein